MKKIFIRIALRMLKKEMRNNPNMSYGELGHYGVVDIIEIESTKEKALII